MKGIAVLIALSGATIRAMGAWMLFAATPIAAHAADELKVSQLEQDVRDLQRQVQALSRQLDTQRTQAPSADAGRLKPAMPPVTTGNTPLWVDVAKWQKLQPGMSELDVVTILGPPTSMRSEGNQRTLLYALEIGSSGFLGGSVTLRDRVVTQIAKPVLQ